MEMCGIWKIRIAISSVWHVDIQSVDELPIGGPQEQERLIDEDMAE